MRFNKRPQDIECYHTLWDARIRYYRCSILNLSEFLPSPRGIQTLIGRVEFKNMLDTLSYHLPEEQFDILWNRYVIRH